MKKLFCAVINFIIALYIIGCNTNSKETKLNKFELKDGEKYIELYYDTLEVQMDEVFKFKDFQGNIMDFYISYNLSDEWSVIESKLIKGNKYCFIYKPFSNQNILDSLQRIHAGTDNFPASGDYIYYIEDSLGKVIFKNNNFDITPIEKDKQTVSPNDNNEIDNKYVEYLKNYESEGYPEIKIVKIQKTNFWITSNHGAGSHQEYFWVLEGNKLIPVYFFGYGGMNDSIEYEFLNIKNNKRLTGKSNWDSIESLKITFIENN